MPLRFDLDEDAEAAALVWSLRDRGLDVTTTAEVQLTTFDDRAQLEWASENARVIVTYNAADFCKLHREFIETNQQHAGIVIMEQQRLSVGERMRRLVRLRATLDAEAMINRLEFLNRW